MTATLRERVGGALFRWRSFTPIPLLALAVPLLWQSRGAAGALPFVAAGLACCAAGQAFRVWVIGQVPDGTSGQNERLIATQLNTAGPYAHTRNPLYLGNLGITAGLCLVAHDLRVLGLVLLGFWLQYAAIIAAEERFLRGQFGAAYEQFCQSVPRFWPRLAAAANAGPARPWSARRALRKEHNPAAAWLSLALVFVWADRLADQRRAGLPLIDALRASRTELAALLALGLVYLAIKGWKHRWFSGGFLEDLRRRVRESAR